MTMEIGKHYGILGVMALLMSTSALMLLFQNPLARIVAGYKVMVKTEKTSKKDRGY